MIAVLSRKKKPACLFGTIIKLLKEKVKQDDYGIGKTVDKRRERGYNKTCDVKGEHVMRRVGFRRSHDLSSSAQSRQTV